MIHTYAHSKTFMWVCVSVNDTILTLPPKCNKYSFTQFISLYTYSILHGEYMCFYTNTHNTNSNQCWQVRRVCDVKPNGLGPFDLEVKQHFYNRIITRPNCETIHLMKFKPKL
jgi:hypothetical protein